MNQSAILGGALLAGFVLFLAARDRLTVYERVLWGAKPDAHQTGGSGSSALGDAAEIGAATVAGGPIGGAIAAIKKIF